MRMALRPTCTSGKSGSCTTGGTSWRRPRSGVESTCHASRHQHASQQRRHDASLSSHGDPCFCSTGAERKQGGAPVRIRQVSRSSPQVFNITHRKTSQQADFWAQPVHNKLPWCRSTRIHTCIGRNSKSTKVAWVCRSQGKSPITGTYIIAGSRTDF
jgi:hypothetical protein